jgi:hypothetical protein
MMSYILGFLLSALFVTVPVNAAILYVDNTKSCPGNGSSSTPYCSIQNAFNNVVAGDTIRIRTGTGIYDQTATADNKDGTSTSPITLEPDTGASFKIRNSGNGSLSTAILIKDSDYWIVRNLKFDDTGIIPGVWGQLKIQASSQTATGTQVLNNTFVASGGSAANTKPYAGGLVLTGCSPPLGCSTGRYLYNTLIDGNVFDAARLKSVQIIYTSGTTFRNNEIKNNKCGVETDGATNAVGVHYTYDNVNFTISMNAIHDFQAIGGCELPLSAWPTWAGLWCDVGGGTTLIEKNKIWNLDQNGGSPREYQKFSTGIFVEAGCHSHTVRYNTVYNVKSAAIHNSYHGLDTGQPPNVYSNNTIYNVGWGFFLKEGVLTMKNNIVSKVTAATICFGCGSGNPSAIRLTSDYGLYNDGNTQANIAEYAGLGTLNLTNWRSRCGCDGRSFTADPLFVSLTVPDFNLQFGSPARSTGENGVDIGAYPYGGSGISLPAAPSNLTIAITP